MYVSLRNFFKKPDENPGQNTALISRHHHEKFKHVTVTIEDSLRVRYRKSRAKQGGNQSDEWSKNNLIHMKAFENDINEIIDIIDNNRIMGTGNPITLYYKLPPNVTVIDKHYEKNAILVPLHTAAIGGSFDTCNLLNEKLKELLTLDIGKGDNYFDTFHPLHLISLYGDKISHHKSSQNVELLTKIFLNNFETIDKFDQSNTTPLHYACISNNYEMVKILIENNAFINAVQGITEITPLHLACQTANENIIKLLLVHGADPILTDSYGNTCLHYAVRSTDNPDIIKSLIRSIKNDDKDEFICAKNDGGITALRLAVEENRLKIAEYLLKQQINHNTHKHETLLVHLAAQRGSPQMVSLIIENGLSIEERDNRGQTPLHFAAEEDRVALVKELIANKADIEARDERGFTPFLAAACRDSINVFREMFMKCLLTALSFQGENVVLIAVKYDSTKIVKYLFAKHHKDEFKKHVKKMLRATDIYLNTALHYVAQTGNVEVFNIIIPYYYDINTRNNELMTPLHIAAKYGNIEIAKLLLSISVCSINLVDRDQQTPLFAAVSNGSISMIKLLLHNGANPMALNKDNKIALDCAIKDGNIQIIKLLLDELKEDEDEFRKVFPLHDAVEKKQLKALKLILKKKYTSIDQINDEGQTCLDLAIDLNFKEGVYLLLQHDKWERLVRRRYIKSKSKNPIKTYSPMQNLVKQMPDMAKVVMDKCILNAGNITYYNYEFLDDTYIKKDPKQYENGYISGKYTVETEKLTPYYPVGSENEGKLKDDFVLRNSHYSEIIDDHPLTLMLRYHCHDLLNHDLVQSYITSKWNHSAKWFYYALCLFHLLFVLFLTGITINIKPDRVMTEQEKMKFSQPNECLVSSSASTLFLIFSITLFTIAILKGLRDWSIRTRLFDILLSIMTFLASTPICSISSTSSQWRVLVLLNFVGWFHLLNLIRKIPRFGVYVQMVWHTIVSFIRFSPVFILFLIPFVVSFHVLLGTERGITSMLKTMIRTLVMLTGEFEYEDTVRNQPQFLIYFMFFLFIFIGSVFLMNLLVGLAVSDTNTTLEMASRTRRRLQIETIHHVEIIMPEAIRRNLWRGFRKVTPGENSFFNMKRISHWCRWLGLPKSAIKDFFTDECNTPLPELPKPDKKEQEEKRKRDEEFEEIKRSILTTQNHLDEIQDTLKQFLNKMMENKCNCTSTQSTVDTSPSTPTMKTHELKMIDDNDY